MEVSVGPDEAHELCFGRVKKSKFETVYSQLRKAATYHDLEYGIRRNVIKSRILLIRRID